MGLYLDERFISHFISQAQLSALAPEVEAADALLTNHTGAGSDFHGWLDLPRSYDRAEFARIKEAAKTIIADCDIFVVIGIGGSYLGARAAIEFIQSQNRNLTAPHRHLPQIFFAGNNLSGSALNELLTLCEGKDVCVNVISKSGTTTEPAIAFRAFKALLEDKYGKDGAKKRIYATTDAKRGTLKALSDQNGYQTFVIPDDVGGRFSVLTACGLLPIAVAGIDIDALMQGARDAAEEYVGTDLSRNLCYRYAAMRNFLYRSGKTTEVLVGFEPEFAMTGEWFKQLFGESEGKDGKGLWPCSAIFSTDLHSLGQFIQQGTPGIFETVVWFKSPKDDYIVAPTEDNGDGLNYLAGKKMSFVNEMAMLGTLQAHNEGGVPALIVNADRMDEYHLGYLFYFFEKACAISGYLLGINPFNQPGVEFYKKNMFQLLGKPQ